MQSGKIADLELDEWISQLVESAEAEGLLEPPAGMKERIMQRAKEQKLEPAKRSSFSAQLFFYGMKVGFTAAAAVLLLFSMNTSQVPREFSCFNQENRVFIQVKEKSKEVKSLLRTAAGQDEWEDYDGRTEKE